MFVSRISAAYHFYIGAALVRHETSSVNRYPYHPPVRLRTLLHGLALGLRRHLTLSAAKPRSSRRLDMEASATTAKVAPWKSIVRSLAQSDSQSLQRVLSTDLTTPTGTSVSDDMHLRQATVSVLERASQCTVIVSWHDPTRCSYSFQLWRRFDATRPGVCSLSGIVINTGDSIYKPISKPRPINASAMMLATEVESRLAHESLEDC